MATSAHIKPININLLPKEPLSESLLGKTLLWALSVGRYIVVFTELIVIMAFLSRFSLDRELTDLNSDINRQLSIIKSYGELESNFRQLQQQLEFISQVNSQVKPETIIPVIASSMPVDVILDSLSIDSEVISISGSALSTQGFARFVSSLQSKPQLRSVQLTSIASGDESTPGIKFSINANVNNQN